MTTPLLYRLLNKAVYKVGVRVERGQSISIAQLRHWPPGTWGGEVNSQNDDCISFFSSKLAEEGASPPVIEVPNFCVKMSESIRDLVHECHDQKEGFAPAHTIQQLRPFFDPDNSDIQSLTDAERQSKGFEALKHAGTLDFCLSALQETGYFNVESRDKNMLFAVGDVIEHKLFGAGVVVGWDSTCKASSDWIETNNINGMLTFGTSQPFYSLLLSDGTSRYCSQENLSLLEQDTYPDLHPLDEEDIEIAAKHGPISHDEVDAYFFCYDANARAYVLSSDLQYHYPHDYMISCPDGGIKARLKNFDTESQRIYAENGLEEKTNP